MKATTILSRCRNAEADMRRLKQRIQQRREAAECITPTLDGVGGGRGAGGPDKIGALVAGIDELERKLRAREEARNVEVAAACVLLDTLPGSESAVLHAYYIRRDKMEAVAKRMGLSDGYARTLKADADQQLDSLSDEQVAATLPAWYFRGKDDRPD